MVPVWFAAFLAAWAVSATALAFYNAQREREARAASDEQAMWWVLGYDAHATLPADVVVYWLN